MRVAVLAGLLVATHATSVASNELQETLALAKYAGFCGAVSGMLAFQDATQMSGGHAFLERFLKTEAARLGMEPGQIAVNCKRSVELYDALFKASDAPD